MEDIPKDLHGFLAKPENRQLSLPDGEVRQLEFFAPEELKLQKFTVASFEFHMNGLLDTDPQEEREYEGYSLIRKCNDYSPGGVVVWFPVLKAYGSADTDHQRIIIYPGVTWSDILREPIGFINGQWYPDRISHEVVNPWA